ncbi:propanediol dehydratase small subunit [Paenibacillus rhizosphaerae]|uniref:Propanediol dehydratase small subunit n=1 Tax=Paenibacillus rhizosphaerae TaxID=297318 RepID=A0A839TP33_9BACL|nr:hypothetical protein [Paenibacillus rhizosphaerae]MBB3128341.1 propanediol dehydratase small subunit [Paenibacillus rhizosphaerae]
MMKAPAQERPEYKGNKVKEIAPISNNPVVSGAMRQEDLRLAPRYRRLDPVVVIQSGHRFGRQSRCLLWTTGTVR